MGFMENSGERSGGGAEWGRVGVFEMRDASVDLIRRVAVLVIRDLDFGNSRWTR